MQDAATLVYQALKNDAVLLALLGGKVEVSIKEVWSRIYNSQVAPNADEYPRLTMFEMTNEDANPADDEPQDSESIIRVDVWLKDNSIMFDVCKQAKKTIKAAFPLCSVRIYNIGYESGTEVYHKQLEINLLLEQEV